MAKRLILLLVFLLLAGNAQSQTMHDITSPFKFWLLNNEARVFSSLSSDAMLTERVAIPFSFMPSEAMTWGKAEEKLWETHRKFYALLEEAQTIYSLARRYGNGKFAVIFKQHRPEIWALLPLQAAGPGLLNLLAMDYRKAFHATLMQCLKLSAERDTDLPGRLSRAVQKLSDEEYRLLEDYFANFSALYPSEGSVRMLQSFLSSGPRKNFAPGIKDLLKPVFTAPVTMEVTAGKPAVEPEDPLAELEKLAAFNDEDQPEMPRENNSGNPDDSEAQPEAPEQNRQPATLEPPPPGTEDLFKIWD
jgi:hypothetical protein